MKKIQNQEPKLVTLKHIASRTSKDKAFFNSLLKAPKTTLKNNALKLSEADGKKLNKAIAKTRRAKSKPLTKLGEPLAAPPPPWNDGDMCPPPRPRDN